MRALACGSPLDDCGFDPLVGILWRLGNLARDLGAVSFYLGFMGNYRSLRPANKAFVPVATSCDY